MNNRSSASRRAALKQQQEAQARAQRTNRMLIIAVAVVAVVVVAIVGVVLAQSMGEQTRSDAAQVQPANATEQFGVEPYAGKAKDGAPHVVVYQNYLCGACKVSSDLFHASFESLADKGEIRLEFRQLAFATKTSDDSFRAAMAVAAAGVVGKWTQYNDEVYANFPTQQGLAYPDELLREQIPAKVGITGDDLTRFQQLYDAQATEKFVRDTIEQSGRDGITHTPTIKVNGKEVQFRDASGQPSVQLTDEAILAKITENA